MNPIVNPQQSTRHRLHQVLKVKSERNTRPLGSGLGLGSGLRRQFGKRRSWLAFELSIPMYTVDQHISYKCSRVVYFYREDIQHSLKDRYFLLCSSLLSKPSESSQAAWNLDCFEKNRPSPSRILHRSPCSGGKRLNRQKRFYSLESKARTMKCALLSSISLIKVSTASCPKVSRLPWIRA